MAQNLIKINYEGEKCAGLYLVDENFGGKEITKADAPQGRGTYKLVLRQTVLIAGHGKITAKETFTRQGTTFLKAIQAVIAEREAMKQRVIDKATGVTATREKGVKEQVIKDKLTLNDLWDAYYIYKTTTTRQARKQKKWDTTQGATGYIMKVSYNSLVKDYLGSMLVKDIKKKHMQEHVDYLIDGLGKAQRTAKTVTIMLKPMFDWYFDNEEIDRRNPAQIEWGALNNERNVVVEYEDMQKLYKMMFAYKDKKYRNVFIWLASGRRIGEVMSLHTDNIKGDYFTVTADNNKAGVDMIYKMSNAMKSTVPKSGYVHTSVRDDSKQLTKESVSRHWYNIKRDSGLFDFHIHDLRHLINTVLEDSEVPLEIRSKVLGHKGTTITDRYRVDTKAQADTKAGAVDFFINKMIGNTAKDMKWNEYLSNKRNS